MKNEIRQNINDPETLEGLFRRDRAGFTLNFREAAAGVETELVRFWRIRLSQDKVPAEDAPEKTGLATMMVISAVVALLVKAHLLSGTLSLESYWLRNLPLIVFSGITAWFIVKRGITGMKELLLLVLPVAMLAVFLNLLPELHADTTILACLHAPVFMWFIFGTIWLSFGYKDMASVSAFIRYNGELVVMSGLLSIAGGLLTAMTVSLFAITGMDISEFYAENIGIPGLALLPVVAAWLMDIYPGITGRIVSLIARIFTPLVLLLVIVYLAAITIAGTNLSADRDSLIVFNLLLFGVTAIILFTLSEADRQDIRKWNIILLLLLVAVTLVIDLYALTAIISRLSEGFTPNRTVVLISNILVLVHLLLILPGLFLSGFRGRPLDKVEKLLYGYLPVYFLYCLVVIFVFPLIFGR